MQTQTLLTEPKTGTIALSKREAARMLGISAGTVDRLIALKELPVRRWGRRVLIPRGSLESFLRDDHPTQTI
jgi:excisionase family DNA binding protein